MLSSVFLLLTVSLVLSLILTETVRRYAIRFGYVAHPQNNRWHKVPTALLGGVAIYIAYFCPLLVFATEYPLLQLLLLGGGSICFLGLLDDLFHFQPYTKLIGQIGVGCLFVAGGQFLGLFDWSILTFALVLLWIVGVTNAFNLLDNMDGLSAGTASITAFCLMLAGGSADNPVVVLVSASLIGATLGFLWFNFYPAKIFMGDSGSLFLGFTLSTLAVTGQWENVTNVLFALLIPVLVLAVPIFDTAFVSLVRFLNGRPISQGGRDHTSHRLVVFGLSERKTVLLFYGMSLLFGGLALVGLQYDWLYAAIFTVLLAIALLYFGIFLNGIVSYENVGTRSKSKPSNVILNLILKGKRRIGEVLLDSLLIGLAFTVAFLIRFDEILPPYDMVIVQSLPLLLPAKLGAFFYFGLYRGLWRYVGIQDLINIIKAVTLGSLISVVLITMIFRFENYSRAVFLIDWMVLLLSVSGVRVGIRLIKEFLGSLVKQEGKRLLIIGAGDAGEIALREIRNNPTVHYNTVGFIDDNQGKLGRKIHGVPVIGTRKQLSDIIQTLQIDEILVAIPSASSVVLENVLEDCRNTGIPTRVLPRIQKILSPVSA